MRPETPRQFFRIGKQGVLGFNIMRMTDQSSAEGTKRFWVGRSTEIQG